MATAFLTGAVESATGKPGDVDTVARNPLGMRAFGYDTTGNIAEYIYLTGVASTIVGSVVTYDHLSITTLIAAGAVGPVAVATGLTVASTFGWYGISGTFLTDVVANCANNAMLGRETTNGKVGDGQAAGDAIFGAVSRAATTAAAVVLCQFCYPSVNSKSA